MICLLLLRQNQSSEVFQCMFQRRFGPFVRFGCAYDWLPLPT
jgi:hypothetical protein